MQSISKRNFKKNFRKALKNMDQRQRVVLISGLEGKTLKQISRRLNVTPPRVWQIERDAWADIKDALRI